MKILVTGFDPFGGEKVNPAFEVIKKLNSNIAGAQVIKLEVPTVFKKSIELVESTIEKENPNIILSIGQAGGRAAISIERIAINIDDARIPDNENNQPVDLSIDPEGLSAHFATIPIKSIAEAIRSQNIPASISDSAGTFVCNHIMYGVLNYIYKNNLNMKAGFIHIPFLPEQVLDKSSMPSMSLETVTKAIEIVIATIVSLYDNTNAPRKSICSIK